MQLNNLFSSKAYRYIKRNFDEAAIISALATIATSDASELTDNDHYILAALRRMKNDLSEASPEEIQTYLSSLSDEQIPGVVSNVKGIVHEMEFVKLENEDNDHIYASMFDQTNHPDTDILFIDSKTGDTWEAQLKATDNTEYVNEWIDSHPDGEILVTTEIADEMGIPTTGVSNDSLTTSVESFVDKMIHIDTQSTIWNYFPALSIASVSIILFELWTRYKNKEISLSQFKIFAGLATGLKVTKIALLATLLTIPVIGQITGALLIASFLIDSKRTWFDKPPIYVPPKALPEG